MRLYIDDVMIDSEAWEEHLNILKALFKWLSRAHLTINLVKSEFGHARLVFLGYAVGQGQVTPMEVKDETVKNIHTPTTKRELVSFLGIVGYYRHFCKNSLIWSLQ